MTTPDIPNQPEPSLRESMVQIAKAAKLDPTNMSIEEFVEAAEKANLTEAQRKTLRLLQGLEQKGSESEQSIANFTVEDLVKGYERRLRWAMKRRRQNKDERND